MPSVGEEFVGYIQVEKSGKKKKMNRARSMPELCFEEENSDMEPQNESLPRKVQLLGQGNPHMIRQELQERGGPHFHGMLLLPFTA